MAQSISTQSENRHEYMCYSAYHVGMVRKVNEDSLLELPAKGFWAVADGMGGHDRGDLASQTVVSALSKMDRAPDHETQVQQVEATLGMVNMQLQAESRQLGESRTIGSTVVFLATREHDASCIWVGDSRLYRFRQGSLNQLSQDHSRVQELFREGVIDASQIKGHPMSHVLTRAVGSGDQVEADSLKLDVVSGDVFLLCSDGLSNMVNDDEIESIINQAKPEEIAKALLHLALARNARDNVSILVLHVT